MRQRRIRKCFVFSIAFSCLTFLCTGGLLWSYVHHDWFRMRLWANNGQLLPSLHWRSQLFGRSLRIGLMCCSSWIHLRIQLLRRLQPWMVQPGWRQSWMRKRKLCEYSPIPFNIKHQMLTIFAGFGMGAWVRQRCWLRSSKCWTWFWMLLWRCLRCDWLCPWFLETSQWTMVAITTRGMLCRVWTWVRFQNWFFFCKNLKLIDFTDLDVLLLRLIMITLLLFVRMRNVRK